MNTSQKVITTYGLGRLSQFLKESDEIEGIDIPLNAYENALMFVNSSDTEDEGHVYKYEEDHVWALSYVLQNYDRLPRIGDVLEIHRRLLKNAKLSSFHIGGFRHTNVMVGENLCPNPASVPYLMDNWCWMVGMNTNALEAHKKFELIHPFVDGNGRTGRLLWLWLRLFNEESVGNFLEICQYKGETFKEKREAYYLDLNHTRHTSITFRQEEVV